jgi:hypothetical protein
MRFRALNKAAGFGFSLKPMLRESGSLAAI